MGALELSGLSAADGRAAQNIWKIESGAPLNGPYVDDYLRAVFQSLNGRVKTVSQQLRPRAGSNTVDVVLTFH